MEITTHIHEERCVLELNGRLDANWSEHVGQAIETGAGPEAFGQCL